MNFVYFLSFIAGNGFFAILTKKVYDCIFTNPKTEKDIQLLCFCLYFTCSILSKLYITASFFQLLTNLCLLVLLSLLYHDYRAKKIFIILSLFLFNSFVHYSLIFISGWGDMLLFNPARLSSVAGITIECVLFYGFFLLIRFIHNSLQNNTLAIMDGAIAVVIPLCTIFLLGAFLIPAERNPDFRFIFAILLLITINLLALFFHGFGILRTRLKFSLYQTRYYQNQLKIIEASEKTFKSLRHDLKNHLIILSNALDQNDLKGARAYLATISSELSCLGVLSKTGNRTIDSLINYKLYNTAESKITLDYFSEVPTDLNIDAFDLTVILGNLLDNAQEALSRLSPPKEKKLSVTLKYDSGRLIIKVSNTYDGVIFSSGTKFFTRKKDPALHGIGLSNVRTAISKYDGELEIVHDKDTFTVCAIIYEKAEINSSG